MKIIIADDSEILIGRLKERLIDIPNAELLSSASNSIEAKRLIKKLSPDLVITDIRMPGGGGLELLEFIKTNIPKIQVMVYTNYPYPQYQEKCIELGAEYFFHKSTQDDEMVTEIENICNRFHQKKQ